MNRNSATKLAAPLIAVALSIVDARPKPDADLALVVKEPGKDKRGRPKKAEHFHISVTKSGRPVTDGNVLQRVKKELAEAVTAQNNRQGTKLRVDGLKVSIVKQPTEKEEKPAKGKAPAGDQQ